MKGYLFYIIPLLIIKINLADAATYTVTETTGTGVGSLAWAINQANSNPGPDIIVFNVSGPIIAEASLPAITSQITFNGGSGAKVQIDLSKGNPGGFQTNFQFLAGSAGSSISNLAICGGPNAGSAVYLANTSNITITNSYFQFDSNGALYNPNGHPANNINISNSTDITISNNYFGRTNNLTDHINMDNGDNVSILNNTFGYTPAGTSLASIGRAINISNGSSGAVISGNSIGNTGGTGINIYNSSGASISTNRIGPTGGNAIYLNNSPNANISSNTIGFLADGITKAGSSTYSITGHGIQLQNGSNGTTINNNLVGNASLNGIAADGSSSLTISNNRSGIASNGTCARNGNSGLSITNVTNSSITNNIFRCNNNENIYISASSGLTITGNTISNSTGSGAPGIRLANTNSSISITGNTMTGNMGIGISLSSGSTTITMTGNSIYCNGSSTNDGIRLNSGNGNIAAPGGFTYGANTTSGTGTAGNTIHLYRSVTNTGTPCQDCEGEILIGTTTVGGGGTWSITHNLNLTGGAELAVTATQTSSTGNTSQFGGCASPPPLPVILLSFSGKLIGPETALLEWKTASEENNKEFIIERSTNALDFFSIGIVPGNLTKSTVSAYSFTDNNLGSEVYYYRLKQIDLDGAFAYSDIISIDNSILCIHLYPNPSSDGNSTLNIFSRNNFTAEYKIFSFQGSVLSAESVNITEGQNKFSVYLPAKGCYFIQIITGENVLTKKLIVN